MDAIKLLRLRAAARRDEKIKAARAEYSHTLRQLTEIGLALGEPEAAKIGIADRRIHESNGKPFNKLTVIQAAERVLSEGKPLTAVELALEIQRRGCRADDDPRAVLGSVRSAFYYHRGRFSRDADGKWSDAI
jgi:hypothetical protein